MNEIAKLFDGFTEDMHCRKHLAIDCDGNDVAVMDPRAIRWCSIGWVWKVDHYDYLLSTKHCLDSHAETLGFYDATEANDVMGYEFIKSIRNLGAP